jgi:hypothetical protein
MRGSINISVALMAIVCANGKPNDISASPDGEVLTLAGTGTLVTDGKTHYNLTAAHVWHDVLKRTEKVGISLREDLDSQCLMERNHNCSVGTCHTKLLERVGARHNLPAYS